MAKKFISLTLLQSYDVKIKKYVGDLMTAANGNASTVSTLVNTLIGDDSNKSARTIAAEEIAKQLIPENANEALNTLQEIAAWIQEHPEDVAEISRRITALENYVGKPADGENVATGLFKAVTDAQAAAISSSNSYTDSKISNEETRAKGVEEDLDSRIEALENKFEGEDSVESQIATAKSEAIAAAAENATTKVNGLKDTAISATNGTDVKIDLGGTVGAPTVNVTLEFAEESDIAAMFTSVTE